MIKRLLNLKGLFSNTKFLIVFSIILAFIFWIVVALEFTPITETTIQGIPITIEFKGTTAELNKFECFNETDFKVDVTIEGKRYEIGGNKITADDFTAVAYTTYVNSAGQSALAVDVQPKNKDAEYKIINTSVDYINVYLDKRESKTLDVEIDIKNVDEDKVAAEGYLFDKDYINYYKELKLSGPKSQIDKIDRVLLEVTPGKNLKKSVEVEGNLVFKSSSGEPLGDEDLRFVYINNNEPYNSFSTSADVYIYKDATVTPMFKLEEIPEKFAEMEYSVTAYPNRIRVAVPTDAQRNLDSIKIDIPYSDFSSDGTCEINANTRINVDGLGEIIVLEDFVVTIKNDKVATESLSATL